MSRQQHLAWCKERALAYVDRGELQNAINSMISDLGKHPETENSAHMGFLIAPMHSADPAQVRRWIEGFN